MAKREPIQSVLALILAVCLFLGTSAPASWLWRCHHTSRLVAAVPTASPNAMPCHMAGVSMAHMACCAKKSQVTSTGRIQIVRSAPCHPTLSQTASLSAASLSPTGIDLKPLASVAATPIPFTPDLLTTSALPTSCPRPPPPASLPASPPARSSQLRAPPVA